MGFNLSLNKGMPLIKGKEVAALSKCDPGVGTICGYLTAA